MAAEPGGIASKLGTIYERRYATELLVRLITGRLVRLRWEPASSETGGADIELDRPDGSTEHVQLKRQNRADAKWTLAALAREGVLTSAARLVDSSPSARFTFMSSDPVPHMKDICDHLTRHAGSAADFIATRVDSQRQRRTCFDELLRRWELTVGDAADEARAVTRLRSMRFVVLDRGEEGEERLNMLVQACLTGDPKVVSALLAAFLEENLGMDVSSQPVLDYLSKSDVSPRDLARDPSLPTAMLALRNAFIESLRPRLVAGTWISRSQVTDIVNRATAPDAPRVILLHGKPGAGKSGVLFGVVEELVAQGVPLLPLSLSTQPPEGTVLRYGEALDLKATPAAALRAVARDGRAVLLVDQLDALRLTTSGATATWGTCVEMLREAARDPMTVLMVACRTFDLENDANIRRWKEAAEKASPGAVVSVEIGDLSEEDVKPVLQSVGVDYGTLPLRLQKLLLHPSALDAWHQLVTRGSARRDFATQTQLLSALIDQLRGEAVRDHGTTDREVYDTLAAARKTMTRTGRLSVPTSTLDAHRAGLRACCGVGLLVRSAASVGEVEVHSLEDLAPRHLRWYPFSRDLLEAVTTLTSHAVAGLADTHCGDLLEVMSSRAASASPSLTRAIAAGLVLSPEAASDQAVEWLLADPLRLAVEDEIGRGRGGRSLARQIVRRHARTCSQGVLDNLESALLALMPTDEKERYNYLVKEYFSKGKWGFNESGRYQPHVNPIGRTQHSLLGAIPEERRSARVKDRLQVWDLAVSTRVLAHLVETSLTDTEVSGASEDPTKDSSFIDVLARRRKALARQVERGPVHEDCELHAALSGPQNHMVEVWSPLPIADGDNRYVLKPMILYGFLNARVDMMR